MQTAERTGLPRTLAIDYEKIGLPVGAMVAILGLTMLVPAVIDLQAGNPDWRVFVESALVVTGLGAILALSCLRPLEPLTLRECFALVVASWLVVSAAGALPLMLTAAGLSFTDAFFEAASALTTTGSTVMSGLDNLPPGVLVWRSMMQWIGGLGIIAFGLLLMPFLGIGGLQLFRIELSDTYEKTVARTQVFARRLVAVYVILTLLCIISYAATGMSLFDAANHAMTTLSTGGFSTHDLSFGYFHNRSTLWFASLFMIAGSLPFSLYVRLFEAHRTNLLDDIQIRTLLAVVAVISLMLVAWLLARNQFGLPDAVTHAVFNVISIITTTGYASTDYTSVGHLPHRLDVRGDASGRLHRFDRRRHKDVPPYRRLENHRPSRHRPALSRRCLSHPLRRPAHQQRGDGLDHGLPDHVPGDASGCHGVAQPDRPRHHHQPVGRGHRLVQCRPRPRPHHRPQRQLFQPVAGGQMDTGARHDRRAAGNRRRLRGLPAVLLAG